jgi:TonB family protein
MMRSLLLGILAIHAPFAWGQPLTLVDDGERIPEPLLIVSPEYPSNPPKGKKSVEVKVRGQVTAEGRFAATAYEVGDDEAMFADSVRAVLEHWRFVPGIKDCKPASQEATLHLWFEMKDGRPSVSATIPSKRDAGPPLNGAKPLKPVSITPPEYPLNMLWRQIEGIVLVLLRINKSGVVEDVVLRAFSPVDGFNEEVLKAHRLAKFEPFDPADWGGKEWICMQREVRFCIKNGAGGFSEPRCHPPKGGFTRGSTLDWKIY